MQPAEPALYSLGFVECNKWLGMVAPCPDLREMADACLATGAVLSAAGDTDNGQMFAETAESLPDLHARLGDAPAAS